MSLSEHFTLEELTHSDLAIRRGLDNIPDDEALQNLKELAGYLEQIRELLGVPLHINSAYRAPKVNAAVGGSSHSAHMRGEAADFTAPGFGTPQEVAKEIINNHLIKFDQLIYEGAWVHFAIGDKMRRQILTAHFESGRVTYTAGIA